MRFLCFLFLVVFLAAVGGFAYFNQESVTVRFGDYSVTSSLAVVAGVVYVLGMVSGWTMIRMVRRSASSVIDSVDRGMTRPRS